MLTLTYSLVDPTLPALLESIVRRHERTRLPADCDAALEFVSAAAISDECYVLTCSGRSFTIAASSRLGFLYGLGKALRRIAAGEFAPKTIRFRPAKPCRGVYFATHFHNYYITAPLEELTAYLEDLTLWGMNAWCAWYDIHAFQSVEDPEAQALAARIRALLQVCKRCGVKTMLGFLANEAFASSDPSMRAEWAAQNGYLSEPVGHYHVELCPNKPGGMQAILETKMQVLGEFADCPPDRIWLWPYDQGGCTCAQCAPWGANGFLTTVRKVAPLLRKALPDVELLLSTWYFGQFAGPEEWIGFLEHKAEIAELFDGMVSEFPFDLKFPEYLKRFPLPIYGFEEISMRGAAPWGGFGANPMPAYLAELNEKLLPWQQGGYLYSEGIFEDLNKVLLLSLFCEPDREIPDILREYARYELGCDDGALVGALYELEETLPRERVDDADGEVRFVLARPDKAVSIAEQFERIDRLLEPRRRGGLRWRQLYLRAQIDRELVLNGFHSTFAVEALYQQLVELYHAEEADYIVSPPTAEAIAANRGAAT